MKYLVILILISFTSFVFSFEIDLNSKLEVKNNKFYVKNRSLSKGLPVHENLILDSVMKANLSTFSIKDKFKLIKELIIGVRWNDDPLNMFRDHGLVGVVSFLDSCRKSISKNIDKDWDLAYRTHCGDMQFLHAMASSENELSGDTYTKALSWLEYTYKTSTGYSPLFLYLRSLDLKLTKENASILKDMMIRKNGKRSEWHAAGIFSLDCTRSKFTKKQKCKQLKFSRKTTQNIALGSLLHLVQDSYSKSHTYRNKQGELVSFGSYNIQDKNKHKEHDKEYVKLDELELINISSKIIENVVNDRNKKYDLYDVNGNFDSWDKVKKDFIDPIIKPKELTTVPSSLGLNK